MMTTSEEDLSSYYSMGICFPPSISGIGIWDYRLVINQQEERNSLCRRDGYSWKINMVSHSQIHHRVLLLLLLSRNPHFDVIQISSMNCCVDAIYTVHKSYFWLMWEVNLQPVAINIRYSVLLTTIPNQRKCTALLVIQVHVKHNCRQGGSINK